MIAMHNSPTWSTILRSPRLLPTAIALICVLTIFSLWGIQSQDHLSYFAVKASGAEQNPSIGFKANSARLKDVQNTTLGVWLGVKNLSEAYS